MILYFSGTGNSEYVAKIIAKENNDEFRDKFKRKEIFRRMWRIKRSYTGYV